MLDSLEKAKTAPWERWIKALGIPMVGGTLGKVVADRLGLEPDGMKNLGDQLIFFTTHDVEGFGDAKMKAIFDWVSAGNHAIPEALHRHGVRPTPVEKPKVAAGAPLARTVFCITGEFADDRDALTKKLVSLGATSKSGVSSKINLLIVGEAAGKSKLSKAKELGIRQEGKDWLYKVLADNGLGMKADFAERPMTELHVGRVVLCVLLFEALVFAAAVAAWLVKWTRHYRNPFYRGNADPVQVGLECGYPLRGADLRGHADSGVPERPSAHALRAARTTCASRVSPASWQFSRETEFLPEAPKLGKISGSFG